MPGAANSARSGVALIALATCCVLTLTASPTKAADPATPAPAPVLAAPPGAAALPTSAGLARALAGPLADPGLGGDPHVEVIDATSGRVLLDRRGQVPATPASTQKLLTAASALLVLGPQAQLTTRVLASGANLYLVGGGDPTLTTQPPATGYPAPADLTTLARTVASSRPAGGQAGQVSQVSQVSQVIGVGSAYGGPDLAPGWSSYYLVEGEIARVRSLEVDEDRFQPGLLQIGRHDDPVLAAAQAFHDALAAAGMRTGDATVGTAPAAPAGARLVASVTSPPVSALVERMLNYSDADLAEGLGRQVAIRSGLPPTFAGVAEALAQVARRLGLPAGETISDASGLSRTDAIAPAALTTLLRQAAFGPYPQLRPLIAALPIAGFTGTLALRFTVDAPGGLGHVRAKTGWLNGTSALAGLVTTAKGRLLIFAALAPAPARGPGEAALDRIAATLAECGCR